MTNESVPPEKAGITGTSGVADRRAVVNVAELRKEPVTNKEASGNRSTPFVALPDDLGLPDGLDKSVPPDAGMAQHDPPGNPQVTQPSAGTSTDAPVARRAGLLGRPIMAAAFSAVDDNGWFPPDAGGAVGPDHLVAVHNGTVRMQEKTGGSLMNVSLDSFWAAVAGPGGTFDPKVLYDVGTNRWIMVACDDRLLPTSGVLVGISQGGDPTAGWNLYKVVLGAFSAWVDYPSVGFGDDFVVVQVNVIDSVGTFIGSRIYSFFKSDLLAGGAGLFTVFAPATQDGGTQVPALGSSATGTMYLLQRWNGNSNGQGWLRIWTLGQTLLPGPFISTPGTWDSAAPAGAGLGAQLHSTQRIQLNDDRIHNNVYCLPGLGQDYLYAVHTVFLPAGGSATRSAIQLWEIRTDGSPAGTSVTQIARVDDPTGAICYAFPSIAVSPVTHSLLIGFSSFSAARYPDAEWAFRWGSDAPNTLQAGGVLRSGEGPYHKTDSSGRNRWGDYSSTVMDPDGSSIWTLQEYSRPAQGVGDGSGRWGSWWAQFQLFEIG
jgi:hypothetical protein